MRGHRARHPSPSGWMRARPAAKLAVPQSPTETEMKKPPSASASPSSLPPSSLPIPATACGSSSPARQARDAEIAHSIWEWAEVGYQETKSSALLQQELTKRGLQGRGRRRRDPDGIRRDRGQRQAGDRHPRRVRRAAGHQPGRGGGSQADRGQAVRARLRPHLFGTASVSAAIAIADWLKTSGTPGTIRVYGTPAEEGGSGKVYMVRAGLFNDVDAVHALASLGRELRRHRPCARQQVREVPLPRPLGPRLGRAGEGPLRARRPSRRWTTWRT